MGGGTDVDYAYSWMCNKAGGGDWLVLRTSGKLAQISSHFLLTSVIKVMEHTILTFTISVNHQAHHLTQYRPWYWKAELLHLTTSLFRKRRMLVLFGLQEVISGRITTTGKEALFKKRSRILFTKLARLAVPQPVTRFNLKFVIIPFSVKS